MSFKIDHGRHKGDKDETQSESLGSEGNGHIGCSHPQPHVGAVSEHVEVQSFKEELHELLICRLLDIINQL